MLFLGRLRGHTRGRSKFLRVSIAVTNGARMPAQRHEV